MKKKQVYMLIFGVITLSALYNLEYLIACYQINFSKFNYVIDDIVITQPAGWIMWHESDKSTKIETSAIFQNLSDERMLTFTHYNRSYELNSERNVLDKPYFVGELEGFLLSNNVNDNKKMFYFPKYNFFVHAGEIASFEDFVLTEN